LAVIPLTVALGISATTSVVFLSQNAQAQALHNAHGDLNQADTSIALFVENQFQLLHSLATDAELWSKTTDWPSFEQTQGPTRLDLSSGGPTERGLGARFERILGSFDHITQVEAGTRSGRYVMAPPGEKPAGYSPTQRPWYQAVGADQKAALTKVRKTSEGRLVVSLSEPFSGQESGVVSLALGLGDLTRVTDSIQVGDHGFVMLFQNDGTIVTAGKTPELEGKTIQDPEASALSGLSLAEPKSRLTWQNRVWDVLAQPSKVPGWVVVAFLDTDEYEQQARTFLGILVGLTLVVLVMALALSTWMAARISAPLKTVARGIHGVEGGVGLGDPGLPQEPAELPHPLTDVLRLGSRPFGFASKALRSSTCQPSGGRLATIGRRATARRWPGAPAPGQPMGRGEPCLVHTPCPSDRLPAQGSQNSPPDCFVSGRSPLSA